MSVDEEIETKEDDIEDNMDWFPNTPTLPDNKKYRVLAGIGNLVLLIGIILLLIFLYNEYGSEIGV